MHRIVPSLCVLALIWGTSVLAGPREDAFDSLRQGMPYAEARETLLGGGWQAIRYPWMTADARCAGRDEICQAYQETDACAGTGLAQCKFMFRDGQGGYLGVVTIGEELEGLSVDAWFLEDEAPDTE